MHKSRFDNILQDGCPKPLYDTILRDTGAMVVTPTLGSIIPNWVLAVPRRHAANAAQWSIAQGTSPLSAVNEIARLFGRDPKEIIWFEHGATEPNSVVGCGVDHAHLHILLSPPFSFERFAEEFRREPTLAWSPGYGDAYAAINVEQSYLVAGQSNNFFLARKVEAAGSQFFRKCIARIVGRDAAWDYRQHPHMDNVARTIVSASLAA